MTNKVYVPFHCISFITCHFSGVCERGICRTLRRLQQKMWEVNGWWGPASVVRISLQRNCETNVYGRLANRGRWSTTAVAVGPTAVKVPHASLPWFKDIFQKLEIQGKSKTHRFYLKKHKNNCSQKGWWSLREGQDRTTLGSYVLTKPALYLK